jgi:hypothetical protein
VYGGLTASPLPHPRTFGSRIRLFGRCSQGGYTPNPSVFSRCASREFLPDAGHCPTPRRRPSRHSTSGRHSSRPFRPSARDRVPVGSEEARSERRWPPSAAQTARAVFPPAAVTQIRRPSRQATVSVKSRSQGPAPRTAWFRVAPSTHNIASVGTDGTRAVGPAIGRGGCRAGESGPDDTTGPRLGGQG